MKFVKIRKPVDIEWKDGAVLKIQRASISGIAINKPKAFLNEATYGIALLTESIIEWTGIVGEDDKPLPFNDNTKAFIVDELLGDTVTMDKITIAIWGAEGNSNAGLTVSSNTDGHLEIASNASEATELSAKK